MKSRSKISLNALRTFEAVARHKSMTDAAQELLVTPGAVSRQISELQETLSFDLFEGPRNQRTATADGQRLASTMTRALDEIEATLLSVDSSRDKLLDLTCMSTSAVRWLIPRLHRFRAKHPDIELRLSTDPRRPDKMVNRVDLSIIALLPGELREKQDTVLFAEQLGLVLETQLLEKYGIAAPADLSRLLRLTTKTRADAWEDWQVKLDSQLIPITSVTEFDHLSLAIEAAANGLGVCVSPEHLVRDDIASGRLVAPFGFRPSEYLYVLRAHGSSKGKSDAFINWLVDDTVTS